MSILRLYRCRTVREVSRAMSRASICEVCRQAFATHSEPPTCDECHDAMSAGWEVEHLRDDG
jgi:hypothetical protein